MKNIFKFLLLLIAICSLFAFTSCEKNEGNNNDDPTTDPADDPKTDPVEDPVEDPEEKKEEDPFENVKFENLVIDYDGTSHRPEVTGAPKTASIAITPNKYYTVPGTYEFSAKVKYHGESKTYKATLTINKVALTVEAEETQDFYLNDCYGLAKLAYTCNQRTANLDITQKVFTEPGTYNITIGFDGNEIFDAIEPKNVTVNVYRSHSGYYLESSTLIVEAGAKGSLPLLKDGVSTPLPAGYTAEFTNNEEEETGSYHVTCIIKDADGVQVDELRAIMTIDAPTNAEFKTYSEEMFVYFLEGDQSTINIFFDHPENYGLEHYDATWYTYEKYTEESFDSDQEEIQRLRNEFDEFKDSRISLAQQNDYAIIEKNISYYEELLSSTNVTLMRQSYVDQYGGYAADLPTTLEAYTLRNEQDIIDLISYVDSIYDSFQSYMDYITDREEAGYQLSGFTLNGMAEYLEGVSKYIDVETNGKYYLIDLLGNRVKNACDELELDDAKKTQYVDELTTAFNEKFLPGHDDLAKDIRTYIETKELDIEESTSYLYSYEGGKELYASLVCNRLGLKETSIDDLIAYVDRMFNSCLSSWMGYYTSLNGNSKAKKLSEGKSKIINYKDEVELFDFLRQFAATIVPELENEPTITVTEMDKTITANTTTLAYYMKSPIDSTDSEAIHINKDKLNSNYLDTLCTLAHEGYPGHLYAYCSTKENDYISPLATIMTCTGHGEGWAKYVESALLYYLADYFDSEDWQLVADYQTYYDLMAYLLESKIDLYVNYKGYTIEDVEDLLSDAGLNTSIAKDIFDTVNEAPGQIIAYGYGMAKFVGYHETARAILGDFYSEQDFNSALLANGWCALDDLSGFINTYVSDQAFLHNRNYYKF